MPAGYRRLPAGPAGGAAAKAEDPGPCVSFFFGAFPQPQAFIEPRPAPTVRKVVLIQSSLTLSGGGLGPPASPRGRVGAGASGPDQERGLRGRRDHFSPSPRSEAASGLVQPGSLSWPSPTDLFILHTCSTRLAFNPVANEGVRFRESEWYVRVTARKVEGERAARPCACVYLSCFHRAFGRAGSNN